MKKIASKYVDPETKEEVIYIEIRVDELDEEQEHIVQQAVEELTRYILRMKGVVSPGCGGCSVC